MQIAAAWYPILVLLVVRKGHLKEVGSCQGRW